MNNINPDNRYYILDPLRFLAAIAVVFYHYSIYLNDYPLLDEVFKYGYLGVNFFFLLSGFVIAMSAEGRSSFSFLKSRAKRIYPTFIICLIFTVLVLFFFKGSKFSFFEIIANATILNDYLGIKSIDGVYWTLHAEVKFYICIFLLLAIGMFQRWKIWLTLWLLGAAAYHFFKQPFFMGWAINPEYSFYFIGGVSAYLIAKNKNDIFAKLLYVFSCAFCLLKVNAQAKNFLKEVGNVEVIVASLIVFSFFLFFYFLSLGSFKILKNKYLLFSGLVSYPLYLIHNMAGKAIIEELESVVFSPLVLVLFVSILIIFVSGGIQLVVEKIMPPKGGIK